jgi:hypothetical protein
MFRNFTQLLAKHQLHRQFGQRHACRLADIRDRSRRPRIHFQHVDLAIFDRVLHIHQADHVEAARQFHGVLFDSPDLRGAE